VGNQEGFLNSRRRRREKSTSWTKKKRFRTKEKKVSGNDIS